MTMNDGNDGDFERFRDALHAQMQVRGWTARGLSLAAKLGPTAVNDILSGKSKRPRMDTIAALATTMRIAPSEILPSSPGFVPADQVRGDPPMQGRSGGSPVLDPAAGSGHRMFPWRQAQTASARRAAGAQDRSLPVRGRAEAGPSGSFVLRDESDAFDWSWRPAPLLNDAEAFAIAVAGESMEPRFRTGEIVWVRTARPPRPGDDVVLVTGDGRAYLKNFARLTAGTIVVRQYNPAVEMEFPVAEVEQLYRVIGCTSEW